MVALPAPPGTRVPGGMPAADVLLADGTVAVIREVRPADRPGLEALHDEASAASLRLRFFATSRRAGRDYVAHLFEGGGADTMASLVATVHDRVVALATAERVPDAAEVAFMVADSLRGRGVGSLLLEHLAAAARDQGVRRFVAEVLAENTRMLRVFLDAGFEISRETEEGTVHVEMGTTASARAVAAADEREFLSEARSLAPLLYPGSVAVTGVRRDGTGVGAAVLDSIGSGGFTGRLCVVHPQAEAVDGVTAYPRLTDVPFHLDLVVVAVPAERVLDTIRDAATAGASSAVVISSGFEELGGVGKDIQREMLRIARDHSMRLVGPNCLGLMSNHPDVRLNATFSPFVPPSGGLAIASQSGGVGIVLIDVARDLGLGVGCFVSLGNKADVSGNDLLAAWRDDPRVGAAALYLESFGNAAKFARVARRFAERKPLLAVVGGRSAGGRRAGASHTAAATTPGVGVDALFAQAGVIGCRSAEEMADTALLLTEQALPAGPRVAIVSNAGGLGVLAADEADSGGLVVPELSPTLREQIARHVTGTAGTSNPVDAGAGAAGSDLAAITAALLDSGEVDAVLVILVRTNVTDPAPVLEALARCRVEPGHPPGPGPDGRAGRPARGPAGDHRAPLRGRRDPLARQGQCVRRMAAGPPRGPPATDEDVAAEARRIAEELVSETAEDGGWLDVEQITDLLSPYGLVPVGALVHSPLAASAAAAHIGFPVAVKVADQHVVHKTDRGLVRVGLQSGMEVLSSVRAFEEELGHDEVPVLVQPVVSGVEVALGVVRDPGFGPMVMVAAGGVATDLWNDRAFLVPPISRADATRALRSLRIWPLLEGYRGSHRGDVDALAGIVVSLGALARWRPTSRRSRSSTSTRSWSRPRTASSSTSRSGWPPGSPSTPASRDSCAARDENFQGQRSPSGRDAGDWAGDAGAGAGTPRGRRGTSRGGRGDLVRPRPARRPEPHRRVGDRDDRGDVRRARGHRPRRQDAGGLRHHGHGRAAPPADRRPAARPGDPRPAHRAPRTDPARQPQRAPELVRLPRPPPADDHVPRGADQDPGHGVRQPLPHREGRWDVVHGAGRAPRARPGDCRGLRDRERAGLRPQRAPTPVARGHGRPRGRAPTPHRHRGRWR
nr:GNAT family N-acetyltransferase [Nocardioides ungokensis]